MKTAHERLIIVGSGPAGLTAALYAARADLNPLVLAGPVWGGLLQQTTEVENFPGYPTGIMGPELMVDLRTQAQRFGARVEDEWVDSISVSTDITVGHKVQSGGIEYTADAIILALGADHRRLGVGGETELIGRGVSYCATCDGVFFRGKSVVVFGGGDSAMEEALLLSRFAEKVTIVNRRHEFRASSIMLDRARNDAKIQWLTPYEARSFVPGSTGRLESIVLTHVEDGNELAISAEGAFVAIGHIPQSALVEGQVEIDRDGYIVVEDRSSRTNRFGIFAAGDVIDKVYRQAITAAGLGCQAALDAERYIHRIDELRRHHERSVAPMEA